jgi:uncharacterized protein YggE
MFRHVATSVICITILAGGRAGSAQAITAANNPQILAHGRGEVEIIPDRAEITVQVETRAGDGARASDQNALIVRAILDTLRRGFRLGDKELATIGYSLRPQLVYPSDGKPPQVTGYVAVNTVRVRTSETARAGAIIDAAIAKGATGLGGLSFYAANTDEARRRALAAAVESARRDAEAMATAAGGRLGQLIELTTNPPEPVWPMQAAAMVEAGRIAQAPTPIQIGDQKVSATVSARWLFQRQ